MSEQLAKIKEAFPICHKILEWRTTTPSKAILVRMESISNKSQGKLVVLEAMEATNMVEWVATAWEEGPTSPIIMFIKRIVKEFREALAHLVRVLNQDKM